MTKSELDAYKEAEVLDLIQQTVDELHRIADRLERHANIELAIQTEREQGEPNA